jgi:hypothetical protein
MGVKLAEGEEVTGDRRRSLNEVLYDLYSSTNVIWVSKSRTL